MWRSRAFACDSSIHVTPLHPQRDAVIYARLIHMSHVCLIHTCDSSTCVEHMWMGHTCEWGTRVTCEWAYILWYVHTPSWMQWVIHREFVTIYLCASVTCHTCTPPHVCNHAYTLTHTGGVRVQHIATHCNTLQHTATHCNTLQHTATHCNTLQHTATHSHTQEELACSTLQHVATNCNTLQHTATHCNTLTHTGGVSM